MIQTSVSLFIILCACSAGVIVFCWGHQLQLPPLLYRHEWHNAWERAERRRNTISKRSHGKTRRISLTSLAHSLPSRLNLLKTTWTTTLVHLGISACVACQFELWGESDYRHCFFSRKDAALPLFCYLISNLMQLLCYNVAITGRNVEETVVSLIYWGSKRVIHGFNYPKAGYIQFCFWFRCVTKRLATSY